VKIAQIGEAVLKTKAREVSDTELAQDEFTQFVQALLDTMQSANGVGIAAPQVFDPRAIMIVASRPNARYPDAPQMEPLVLFNPHIIEQSEHNVWAWEGCLSVPGLRGRIERPDWVDVSYLSQDGQAQQQRFEGFVARIFLHEYDHLIGLTWLDHIQSTDNVMAEAVWLEKMSQS
jgi:peptide deformylase